jgi:hypothetical protein
MCFSATASFVAGASLTVLGVATLRKTKSRSEIPFALIPLLFGAQQLIEGVIWLSFANESPLLRQFMTYMYTGFSHVLWPIYVPFAMGFLEAVPWRKKAIFAFGAVGAAVSLFLLYLIVTRPVAAEVIAHHMVYFTTHFFDLPVMALYVAATCFSCFFSSHGFVRMFGGLQLMSLVAAYMVDMMALFSVWCFFAAILSLLIYVHLRWRGLGGFAKRPFFTWAR